MIIYEIKIIKFIEEIIKYLNELWGVKPSAVNPWFTATDFFLLSNDGYTSDSAPFDTSEVIGATAIVFDVCFLTNDFTDSCPSAVIPWCSSSKAASCFLW